MRSVRLLRNANSAPPPDVTIAVSTQDGVSLVRVGGELDLSSVPQLRSTLSDLVNQGRLNLVLDLADVTFCDSTALGVFVGVHRRVTASGGRVEFHHPPGTLRHLLVVSGLDQILDVR